MSDGSECFHPSEPILSGQAESECCACVTIPARNEEETLPRCLDALDRQMDLGGSALRAASFEVLLLLNNCTDRSAEVVREWRDAHRWLRLHVVERTLPPDEAHVGTARRLLLDTAWSRLRRCNAAQAAILATDADSEVAPDWIAQNLRALQEGADVVGGAVDLLLEDLVSLPEYVRRCYQSDRQYARLVARLEDLLDPQAGDSWPRHLDHFGSSLACTPTAYAKAGGMPAVSPLEDEAFIDAVRRAGLRLRHEPGVRVSTSARLDGRAVVGLAGQFRLWSSLASHQGAYMVASAAFVEYRFRFLRRLRDIFRTKDLGDLQLPTEWWVNTFQEALQQQKTCPGFLGAVYCDILIAESFRGNRQEPVEKALDGLERRIHTVQCARPERSCKEEMASLGHAEAAHSMGTLANSVQ